MTAGELLNLLLPRLSKEPATDTYLNSLNNAIRVVTRRLLYRKSSLLKEAFSGSFGAGISYVDLPTGYLGFCPDAPPSVSGTPMFPLPPYKYGSYSATGTPEFYDVRGGKLNLYPTPTDATTVTALYFFKPDMLTNLSGDLPWFGLLDDLLGEALSLMGKTGQWGSITAEWEALINREVDKLLSVYGNRVVGLIDVKLLAK